MQHVNKLKPRFLLVSGDLTNAWPVGPQQDPAAAAKQVVAVKEATEVSRACLCDRVVDSRSRSGRGVMNTQAAAIRLRRMNKGTASTSMVDARVSRFVEAKHKRQKETPVADTSKQSPRQRFTAPDI